MKWIDEPDQIKKMKQETLMRKIIMIVLGILLSTILFASTAQASVTMVTPSSGPLPRVIEVMSENPVRFSGCHPCSAEEGQTFRDDSGMWHATAIVWLAPLGTLKFDVHESGEGSSSLPYTVTQNKFDPFGVVSAELQFFTEELRSGKKRCTAKLNADFFMTAPYQLQAVTKVQRQSSNGGKKRWKTVNKEVQRNPLFGDLAGSYYMSRVVPRGKIEFDLLKQRGRKYRVLTTFRVSGSANYTLKRVQKLTPKICGKGSKNDPRAIQLVEPVVPQYP